MSATENSFFTLPQAARIMSNDTDEKEDERLELPVTPYYFRLLEEVRSRKSWLIYNQEELRRAKNLLRSPSPCLYFYNIHIKNTENIENADSIGNLIKDINP